MPGHDRTTTYLDPDAATAPADDDDDDAIESVLDAWVETMCRRETATVVTSVLPALPAAAADSEASDVLLGQLRRFHAGFAAPDDDLPVPGDDVLPALLQPFRDATRVRHDYPLVLDASDGNDPRVAIPLGELLLELTTQVSADPDESRILRDNLPRLERCVRERPDDATRNAAAALTEAARLTEDALALHGDSGARFHADLETLIGLVPPDATLLPLGPRTALELFLSAAGHHATQRHATLVTDVTELRNRLRDVLRLDDAKHAGTDRPDALAGSLGAGAGQFDPAALARVVGSSRGAVPMPPERRDRITEAIDVLERTIDEPPGPVVHVVRPDPAPADAPPDVAWRQADPTRVCREAADLFDEIATRFAELFGAMRLARLELEDAYDATRHDGLRATFDWQSFTRPELLALPLILAVESSEHLAGKGMLDLTRLLLSGRPINVLVTVQPATNPGFDASDEPLAGFRFELGYLGMSHREALVNQSSAARPEHLLAGFRRGVEATRAALHVVASGLTADGDPPPLGAWLHGGAALEGRGHPLFHYDPEAGETWARRLDFAGNPRPSDDWPVYGLPCTQPGGERQDVAIAFTFADFALMEPCYRHHFRVVPDEVAADRLITLDYFLSRPAGETDGLVPYIRAVAGDNHVRRIALTRRLAFACRDRLGYWHTLQELAGVRNEYVREAKERQREQLAAEFATERETIAATHAGEIERVRAEAAGEAMRRLAETLLSTDVTTLAAPAAASASPAAAPRTPPLPETPAADAPEPPPAPAAESPATDAEPEEPWIESALCTTCNDCMDINPRVFVYNANKQAVIADPRAGTYDELVRAAEKCPARCIHPGTPLDPDEPNLETLVERAKPFNV